MVAHQPCCEGLSCLHEGASVMVTAAREQADLDWFSQQGWSQRVLVQLADVTDAPSCEQVVVQALQCFGKLDGLVNNAGRGMKYASSSFMTQPTRFWEVDPQTLRMIIETNIDGPFYRETSRSSLSQVIVCNTILQRHEIE
ncbi:MAG: SDR family NAD(P)-dependent oxidoreductase [Ktedonobacteraceae bacterium]